MGDSDDVMKLNKEDLFGDDSTQDSESHPEASPLPAAETVPPVEIPVENEIKFNDLTNKPTIAPMIRMQKKGMRGVVLDLGFGAGQPAGPIPKSTERNQTGLNAGNAAGQSTHSESSFKLIQRGKSAKPSEPEDYFKAYDHFRKLILEELKDSVGLKKTCGMLVKTFEDARQKFPDVFRNANWNTGGNLLEDGSLNVSRMLENRSALDTKQADMILDTALNSLLNLRLQAIEKGLGADAAHIIKERLKKWADEGSQKEGFGIHDPKILKRLGDYLP